MGWATHYDLPRKWDGVGGLGLTTKTGLVVFLLLLSQTAWPVEGQRCSGDLVTDVPTECRPLIPWPFFLPPQSYNITRNDITRQSTIAMLSLTTTENSCRFSAVKFACASAYQPCSIQRISPSLPNFLVFPLPQAPSWRLCNEMYESCQGILLDDNLPDCGGLDNSTGEPFYPNTTTTWVVNGNTYKVPVNHYPEDEDAVDTSVCPFPLRLRKEGKANPPCQYPCPNPLYDKKQHRIKDILTDIGGAVSFVCSLYVFLCWMAQEKLRKFPANLPLFPIGANIFGSLFIIIASGIGHENVVCQDHFTYSDTSGFCGVQGFFLALALGINIFYFFLICLNLFLLVVLELHLDRKWYQWSLHCIGLGVPTVFSIIIYAAKKYEGGTFWCFTTYGPNIWWVMATTYGWMGIFFAANTIMIPMLLYKIHRIQQRTGKVYRTSGMLTFVIIFQVVFGWEFCVIVSYDVLKDVWTQAIVDYTVCNMQLRDDCEVSRQYDYWLAMVSNLLFLFAGVYYLIAFTMDLSVHVYFFRFMKKVFYERQWGLLLTGLPKQKAISKAKSRKSSDVRASGTISHDRTNDSSTNTNTAP